MMSLRRSALRLISTSSDFLFSPLSMSVECRSVTTDNISSMVSTCLPFRVRRCSSVIGAHLGSNRHNRSSKYHARCQRGSRICCYPCKVSARSSDDSSRYSGSEALSARNEDHEKQKEVHLKLSRRRIEARSFRVCRLPSGTMDNTASPGLRGSHLLWLRSGYETKR